MWQKQSLSVEDTDQWHKHLPGKRKDVNLIPGTKLKTKKQTLSINFWINI